MVQVVIAEMLEAWGDQGFEAHVRAMQAEYGERASVIQASAQRHLAGLAEWQPPAAGMFLWVRLLQIPDARSILDSLKDAGVVVVPGAHDHMHHDPNSLVDTPFQSGCFAGARIFPPCMSND